MAQCPQLDRLKEEYTKAVNAYGKALTEARLRRSQDARSARHITQECSQACQTALQAFMDHIKEHGCNQPNGRGD